MHSILPPKSKDWTDPRRALKLSASEKSVMSFLIWNSSATVPMKAIHGALSTTNRLIRSYSTSPA